MSYDYQLRKDINRVITFLNNLEKIEDDDSILALLKEELGKYYDSSEVDVISDKLNNDLEVLDDSLTDLTDSLIEFNDELISFDEDNNNLKGDLSKLKDNLHRFTSAVDNLSTDLTALDTSLSNLSDDVDDYADAITELQTSTSQLSTDLTSLDNNLSQLSDDVDEYGDAISGLQSSNNQLSTDLTSLDSSLTQLETDVDGYAVSINNLLTAVGDNNSGLVKSMNTLRTTVGDANSGLVKQANDTATSLGTLSSDVSGLGTSVTGLMTKVGDSDSGLVKGLNDLTAGLNDLEDDVFGANGLESSVNGLSAAIGGADSGLIKDLNDLDDYTKDFYDDVYGNNGLSTQLSTLEGVINNPTTGLATQITGLDNRVFGTGGLSDNVFGTNGLSSQLSALEGVINNPTTGLSAQLTGLDNRVFGSNGLSDSIFGTNGLASRIGTAEGGLSNLTDSLDTLVDFLTNFEGTLDDFEEALEEDSNIDTSELNSSITALLGLIAGVKNDVDVVDGNLSDVSDSFNGVKSNLYGTKTVTIDGETVTVPKDPTDSPSSTSLRGHLDTLKDTTVPAVQTTLYGGSGNSPESPSSNSLMGKTNAVKADLYGTKTVNGQTVPKEPSDTASSDSLSGHLTTLKDTTVPAVQNTLYGGEGNSPSNPSANSLMGKTNAVKADLYGSTNGVPNDPSTASNNSFKTTIEHLRDTTVPEVQGIATQAQTATSNIKGDLYGTKTVNGQTVPREPNEASSTSFKTTVTTLRDTTVPAVQGEIFGTDNQGKPLNSSNYSSTSLIGRADAVQEDIYGDGQDKQGVLADLSDLTGTITDEGGLIDQLDDVGDGVDSVKGEIYGTKTITVDGQQVTVPKDSTDTPSSDSVIGKANAIKNDLYGANGTPSQPAAGSVRGDIKQVKDVDIPQVNRDISTVDAKADNVKIDIYGSKTITVDGQQVTVPKEKTDTPDSNSVKGLINTVDNDINNPTTGVNAKIANVDAKADNVKIDIYGSKTVNGQTVPKEKTDTPDANSVKGLIKTVTDEDIPLVKNLVYGEGDTYVEDGVTKYYDVEHPSPDSTFGLIDTVENGIDTANGHIDNITGMMYGNGANDTPATPATDTLIDKINVAKRDIGTVQTDITDLNTVTGTTKSKVQTDGSLQTQLTYLPSYISRLFVTRNADIYVENVNYAKINVGEVGYIVLAVTELAKKIIRDNGSITYTIYVTDPDNVTTTVTRTQDSTSLTRQSISFTFSKAGMYVIACEHLKYVVMVGNYGGTWESVNTGISGVTFYVNQTLRLVEFNYDMNSYSFTAGYNAIGTLPSTYIPKTHITLSLRSGIQYGYVDKDDMKIYIHNNGAGTANVHASGMWHY